MSNSNSQVVEKMWDEWNESRDEKVADFLIEHYMYIVDFHVERIASHIPDSFEKNDLRSLGLMGLYDALTKFEASRNLQFSTYASIRVRGSITDGLRKEDWLPRRLRKQTKQIDSTITRLEQALKRTPKSSEIAEVLAIDEKEVETLMTHDLYANIISLESTVSTTEDNQATQLSHMIEDDTAVNPDQRLIFNELTTELVQQIKNLNKNEQLVISLFYEKELTLTEIGEVLNLTTSRISQIHKRAIFKLRETLSKLL